MSASMESPSRLSAAPPALCSVGSRPFSKAEVSVPYGRMEQTNHGGARRPESRNAASRRDCLTGTGSPSGSSSADAEQSRGPGGGSERCGARAAGGRAPLAPGQKNSACGSAKVAGAPNPLADVLPQVLQEKLMSWTPADCTLDTSGASEAKLRGQYESL
ncbi:uncharacterized protein LOC116786891 isoform X2 [Chiroxiphia lanceolata]|uniref:uncharacterized protein LOC116786891 isoform X2 n=1 Tax=Chiroxiphia lanceolata TaxID=296741 RepID=UPI0013CED644|nr:uncharacterized protein LOC116786891 isoform X2 [Chiroxiphia lanceolata]